MPELPEVETIRQQLEKELVGDSFTSIEVLDPKVFVGEESSLVGEKVAHVGRVGKYLFVHFESGRGIGIHLKMTGRLLINAAREKHTRIITTLASRRVLSYWDVRKFGYWNVIGNSAESEEIVKKILGPEPWNVTHIQLLLKLQKTKIAIKDVLLDQHILSGIGNIYANDALWLARINPQRSANSLRLTETRKLLKSLRTVLERGLTVGGASDNTYRDLYGGRGGYQNEFLVYGRTGQPCNRCSNTLVYTRIGGRGTWYCDTCQK